VAISREPGPIELCHCSMCRRANGSAFSANAELPASAVTVLSGLEFLTSFESSPGHERLFCAKCGSPIFSRTKANPSVVRIRVGIITDPLMSRPAAHFYTGSMANWWTITDSLMRYETE
jgi:hypothetical protein